MSSIFLSHTSIDKPFVEKLARDLKRVGVNVWFDKWNIKVGDSITWKIEEGIRENEYLGTILSPEALDSEWVKNELGAGWIKQMQQKKVIVLPIHYRNCQIPLFLSDRKFADFRTNYDHGLTQLVSIFGIKETETISKDNWRKFATKRKVDWKKFKIKEFEELVTTLVDCAINYNWSTWVGGTANEFSITMFAYQGSNRKSVSIKLVGKTNAYMASLKDAYNPNHLKVSEFNIYVGNSIEACQEFVWRIMEDFKTKYGNPIGRPAQYTEKFLGEDGVVEMTKEILKKVNWYKGDKL